jgi:hypothetical protein
MNSKLDMLLARLSGVRQTGSGKFLARCPAHDDRSPSLAIKLVGDRILLHDFGGCALEKILAGTGLNIGDLFPDPPSKPDYQRPRRGKKDVPRFSRFDLFPKLIFEACILSVAMGDLLDGRTLSDADLERVQLAQATIMKMRIEVGS